MGATYLVVAILEVGIEDTEMCYSWDHIAQNPETTRWKIFLKQDTVVSGCNLHCAEDKRFVLCVSVLNLLSPQDILFQ